MALGKLDIIIAGDTAKLRKDMSTAVGIMQSSTKQMESFAKNAAGLIGGYFTADLFRKQINQTLEFAESLNKLRQKTGMSADSLYSLNAAAELADVNYEDMSKSLTKFSKAIGETSAGTGESRKSFDRLGISIKNQDGTLKNSFDLLGEVADQFEKMPDGATKATIAMGLFGKSGTAMIPLLNEGKDSLRQYLGIMDNETARAAESFNDSLKKISLSTRGGLISVMKEALPFMEDMTSEFENMSKKGSFLTHNAEYIAGSFDILSASLQGSKEVISSVGGIITNIAQNIDGYDSSLKSANDTTEKTLTLFQFLAVDVKTASLVITMISNSVQGAINDFMNLGFEAEKSFLKMKSFVGAGSNQDDYRIAQLSSFIANRNMDSANLALKEAEIAKSILDYQDKASAQNWARENHVLDSFKSIDNAEIKGFGDTQKVVEIYNQIMQTRDEAISKADGDADKITVINEKYARSLKTLNENVSQKSAGGLTDENDLKKYNATLAAQIQGLEKQFGIRTQIENLNIEAALRNDAISKPEAEYLKEKNDILSQIAKNQETINLLGSKKYDLNNENDKVADQQKVNDLQKENELNQRKIVANQERYNATIQATNNDLKNQMYALDLSETDKQYADLVLKMQELAKAGADFNLRQEYGEKLANRISVQKQLEDTQEMLNLQEGYIALLDDEDTKKIALVNLDSDRRIAEFKYLEELTPKKAAYYQQEIENEEKLRQKTLEHLTTYGQVIDGVASDMTSSFQDFFDYTNDGFMKFGNLAKNILSEVYNEIIKIAVVKPLVSSLTTSAFSLFSTPSTASASTASSYSLGSGGSLTNSYFQAYNGGMIPFASGGYTGDGGKYEPKGVVHGGEYVMPSWMVQKNKPLVSALETTRIRGYSDGGSVGGNVSGGNMRVEIKNESPQSLEVTSATKTYDSEGAVLSIVINGIQKNKMGLRDMLGAK